MPLGLNLDFSSWKITNDDLENGIKIESKNKLKFVTVSRNIFPVEESEEVLSPDKELYSAVVQFVTENGTNRSVIESILQKRYGISVRTSSTGIAPNRTPERYSNFENDDLMLIISVFEEFPQALHKIPQLKYIIRRIDTEEKGMSYARPGRGSIVLAESILMRSVFIMLMIRVKNVPFRG